MNRLQKSLDSGKKVFNKITNPYWRAKQKYIRYYETLPIDDYIILLESEHGKKLNGNIFYLVQHISQREDLKDYEVFVSCWGRYIKSFKSFQTVLETHGIHNVHLCIYNSKEYYKILSSAKYLINDTSFGENFIKKDGQIYLNTWHGTPFKALGRETEKEKNLIGNVQKNFVVSDYILFPNEHTRDVMMRDYMLDNLTGAKEVFCGYPRNTVFFDTIRQEKIREILNPERKRLYAYMPTFRGTKDPEKKQKNNDDLLNNLRALDQELREDEVLFFNLHPLAKASISADEFKHIREMPSIFETYEVLSICDCLITDYSSVFFDYATTGRKIVLFTYDYEEYLSDRGTYLNLEDFPFPKVRDVAQLLDELRTPKTYDDSGFMETYAPYESKDASAKLIDLLLFGREDGLRIETPKSNNKKNVLIYAGNLEKNGITSSLINLFKTADTEKRNYYLSFKANWNKNSNQNYALQQFPQSVCYFPMQGDMNVTIWDRIIRKLFKKGVFPAPFYTAVCGKRIRQDKLRCYGNVHFDTVIHFNGYENETMLLFSFFDAERIIYVHSDMQAEIKTRGIQRRDVLEYIYRNYDKVAVVTKDIVDSTGTFIDEADRTDKIRVCRNLIDYHTIQEGAHKEILLDENTEVFPNKESFFRIIESPKKKFISVGRFSPEKGHRRLISAFRRYCQEHPDSCLIIMGGNSWKDEYQKTARYIQEQNMENNVMLLLRVSNPFPIVKSCDAFILSSYYEGFGLVLAEADILGLPVVSTECTGPCSFLKEHGGTLVENSEEGIYQGLCMLGEGKINPMNADYDLYNLEAVKEFESLFT